jgi:hypothetical protein
MVHFSTAQWFEFAHGTPPPEQEAAMRRHLEEGCDACQKLSAMWKEVLELSGRESGYQPPSGAVRSVKAMFVPERRWKWLPEIAEWAQLLFDSIREPSLAAVRGSQASSRQFLQEARPFVIDLRMECEPARKKVHLIGQVVNSKEPNKNVADVEVFLLKGEHLAARTMANISGEFDLEFVDEEDLQLFIDIRGQKVIEIRLPAAPGKNHESAGGTE